MEFELDKLRELVSRSFVPQIQHSYGDTGVATLMNVMENIRKIYQFIEPEIVNGSIVLFQSIENTSTIHPEWKTINDVTYFAQECPVNKASCLNIELCFDGSFKYDKDATLDLSELSQNAIVYYYSNRQESFVIKGTPQFVISPSSTFASVFSIPTYRSLREALEAYKRKSIKTSNCPIFSDCWYRGRAGSRLYFLNKPEATMRRSLANFLDNVLRGVEVGQEQNVDESHPVDIKVTWMLSNRRALIEIKWLGKSVNEAGQETTEYSEYRANQGAKQLSDYIDAEYMHLPVHDRRGYLVIFDARRRNLTVERTTIGSEDGLWYQNKDINFDPKYHELRLDFEEPVRMFSEPIITVG